VESSNDLVARTNIYIKQITANTNSKFKNGYIKRFNINRKAVNNIIRNRGGRNKTTLNKNLFLLNLARESTNRDDAYLIDLNHVLSHRPLCFTN